MFFYFNFVDAATLNTNLHVLIYVFFCWTLENKIISDFFIFCRYGKYKVCVRSCKGYDSAIQSKGIQFGLNWIWISKLFLWFLLYIYIQMYKCMHIYKYVYIYIWSYMHWHIYICTYIYIYITNIYIYIYIHNSFLRILIKYKTK